MSSTFSINDDIYRYLEKYIHKLYMPVYTAASSESNTQKCLKIIVVKTLNIEMKC